MINSFINTVCVDIVLPRVCERQAFIKQLIHVVQKSKSISVTYTVHLLTYIDGMPLSKQRPTDAEECFRLGKFVGEIRQALKVFLSISATYSRLVLLGVFSVIKFVIRVQYPCVFVIQLLIPLWWKRPSSSYHPGPLSTNIVTLILVWINNYIHFKI